MNIFLRFTLASLLSIGTLTAFAQQKRQKLFPSQLNRSSWFGEDMLVRDNTLFVSDPEWKKDGTGIQCNVGYGALSIFKKNGSGNWVTNQVIKHTANTGIENKFSRNFSYKNNILVVSSEREDYNSTTTRAGAFYLYRRTSNSSSFTQVTRVFSPVVQKDNEFSSGGVATNGQHIAVYDFRRQLLYLFEIQGNSVIYHTSFSIQSYQIKGITDENIVVLTQPSGGIQMVRIVGNTLQAVSTPEITPPFIGGFTGHASVDGNTIAIGTYTQSYGGGGWYNRYSVKVVKMQNAAVQSIANISFPHYTTVAGSLSDIYIRENAGIAVSFKKTNVSPAFTRAFLLKYHDGKYHVADAAMLSESADIANQGGYYGTSLAYDGTDLFVGDKFDKTNYNNNGYPCTAQSASGAVYVYSAKDPLEYSVNGAQKLTSVLGQSASQYDYQGHKNVVYGNWAFSSSLYDADANSNAGSVSVMKKTGGQWRFIRKIFHETSQSNANYATSMDADNTFLAIGTPHINTNPTNGEVYLYLISTLESDYPEIISFPCPDTAAHQQFGTSVAIDGDYLAVGAIGDGTKGSGAGAVYIFKRGSSIYAWTFIQKIVAANGNTQDRFGTSIDLSNGWLIVGAPYADNTRGTDAGTVYFYQLSGSSFVERNRFTPSSTGNYQYMGRSVAIHNANAVASVHGRNSYTGAVNTYTQNGNNWTAATMINGSGGTGAHFGLTVAISGDKMLVGEPYRNKVYKYQKQNTSWVAQGALAYSSSSYFGFNVALHNDDAIIGSQYANNSRGEAYLINFWNISGARMATDDHMTDFYSADEYGITLFPNPVSGAFVNISAPEAILQVRAYNLMGTTSGTLPVSNGQVDISSLNEGFYTLQIETTEKTYTERLIVKQTK